MGYAYSYAPSVREVDDTAAAVRYSLTVAYKPTAGMIAEAKRGLAWRRDGNRGGTAVGLARARDISNNKQLPLDTVKRMYSFFARHEVDKKAKGFRPGEKGYPSPGRVAWALWGGDAGFTWSKRITEREKKTKSIESASIHRMTDVRDSVVKAEIKTEDGLEYPAQAFAYVPDSDKPSTWKLRLWQTPEMKVTRRQVGAAVAALGKGYRGNRVRIPAADLPAVKAKVLRAWLSVHPEMERSDAPRVLLASRITAQTPAEEVDKRIMDKDYKGNDWTEDAMTLMLMAYRTMLDNPECEPLLDPLMELIHAKQQIMVDMAALGMPEVEYDSEFIPGGTYADVEHRRGKKREYRRELQLSLDRISRASLSQLTKWMSGFDLMANTSNVEAMRSFVQAEIKARVSKGTFLIEKADAKRYTLGPVYVPGVLDAHNEFTDHETLQDALWGWMRKNDRSIYIQHTDKVAGEFVELLTWPFPVSAPMSLPGEVEKNFEFPANTPFMGVVWEPWAWELVKAGELRGYSIGGSARRMEADMGQPAMS